MIDRTNFDLRIADHSNTTANINRTDWQHGQPTRRPIRAALANALVSLAARLAPISPASAPRNQASQDQPATA